MCLCIYIYIEKYICVCVHTYMYLCRVIHVCVNVCIYIHYYITLLFVSSFISLLQMQYKCPVQMVL